MSKADIIRKWYQSVWVDGDFDQIDALYSPAAPGHCLLPDSIASPVDIREMITILRTLVTDIQVNVVHLIENGPWIAAILEMTACSVTTNAAINVRWQVTFRIEGDTILESYPSFDFVPFFEQLGQLPEDAFELLLTGAVLDIAR